MRVGIAGGHGKIGRLIGWRLAERGDTALGVIRKPEHADDLRADGVLPLLVDLERASPETLAEELGQVDAVVFAAGAGPGSGAPRKDTVDRAASVLLADACELTGTRRFVQISSVGTTEPNPPDVGEVFGAYLDAKRAAEADLRARDLDWTILRPGRLTDDEPTGLVALGESVSRADVTRADVAEMTVAILDEPASVGHAWVVVNGAVPIRDALARVVS